MEGLWRRGCSSERRRTHPDVDGRRHEPESSPQIFIRPPAGWDEDPDVVYEVLRPLYGIPSSARALGCQIIRDRVAGTLKLVQGQYIRRILETHGMTEANPVKTPLAPGIRLSKRDCPERNVGRRNHVEPS